MARPPTAVILNPGTVLTDAQRTEILAKALQTHYYEQYSKMEPAERDKAAMALAKQMVHIANQCGKQHLLQDVSRNFELISPTREECLSFEDLLREIVVIRTRNRGPDFTETTYKAIKRAAGITWVTVLERLGLPPEPAEESAPNAAPGARG